MRGRGGHVVEGVPPVTFKWRVIIYHLAKDALFWGHIFCLRPLDANDPVFYPLSKKYGKAKVVMCVNLFN